MILIKNAQVFAPKALGKKDVLLAYDKILEIADCIEPWRDDLTVIDAAGKMLVPGFIDQHVHIVGGLISVSMPNFWLGLLLVILFALKLRWLPSQGMGEGTGPMLKSLILPAVTLGTGIMATIMRMTRSSVLETMRQDYVSTARAKGISESQVTTRHMLKNALIPIITSAGLQFGHLLGGSMLTETVFSWPGVGRYMLEAIKTKDTPAVLGSVILMSVSFSVVNLFVDILYAFVDPRIKSQYKKRGKKSALRAKKQEA